MAKRRHELRAGARARWALAASLVGLFALTAAAGPAHARSKTLCSAGEGKAHKKVAGFQVVVTPFPDEKIPSYSECQVEVIDPDNNVIFDVSDWSFSMVLAGRDVNGDGSPDLVLETYSGGAHCCWTYYIISLGPKPGLLLKLKNNRHATFLEGKKTGRIYLQIEDGAFGYFDKVCHACSPFPLVYLRLDGSSLVDISSEYASDYDETISDNQKALAADERQQLKTWTEKLSDAEPVREAVYKALMIVLAYLYSGREAQAHQALHDLWPPFDQVRIWNLILETRHDGILCYTRKDAACGPDIATE